MWIWSCGNTKYQVALANLSRRWVYAIHTIQTFCEKKTSFRIWTWLESCWPCRPIEVYQSMAKWLSSNQQLYLNVFPCYPSCLLGTNLWKSSSRLVCRLPWNGTDKATRISTISDYAKGGLKWLTKIEYNVAKGLWKWYLLTKFGSLFLFNCNYDVAAPWCGNERHTFSLLFLFCFSVLCRN